MPEESIDACVTDTPYGLSTLLDPPNLDREALWQKLTAGLREQPIVTLLRAWLDTGENPVMKGRGFMGKEWDALVPPPNTWRAVWRVMKPGAYCLAFAGTRTYDLITMSLRLAAFEIEDTVTWLYGQGMPKRVRLELKIHDHIRGSRDRERDDVGDNHVFSQRAVAGFRDELPHTIETPEAQRFVGWDRASRPGWEPIIVAVKPLRGTIAETALRYGTGGMNADGCRIPRGDAGEVVATRGKHAEERRYGKGLGDGDCTLITIDARGGFPANVIIDEDAARELDQMSGSSRAGTARTERGTGGIWAPGNGVPCGPQYGDEGGASRFFYTAKASTSERDKGLENLPVLTPGERSGGREEGSAGINGYAGTRGENGRNPGPCVKPISLMRYLVRRASPPGAWGPDVAKRPVVLDCFMGSGSTGVAAMVEGVRFVGCEMDPQMAEVATLRLRHAYAMPREEGEAPAETRVGGQKTLF